MTACPTSADFRGATTSPEMDAAMRRMEQVVRRRRRLQSRAEVDSYLRHLDPNRVIHRLLSSDRSGWDPSLGSADRLARLTEAYTNLRRAHAGCQNPWRYADRADDMRRIRNAIAAERLLRRRGARLGRDAP